MRAAVLIALLPLVFACERRRAPEPPLPSISTSSVSAWTLARGGTDPAFKSGSTFVFVTPSGGHEDHRMAGVTIGDAKGPRYGLLGGYFAPNLGLPDSQRAYSVSIDARAEGLAIRFGDALSVRVLPPSDARVTMIAEGSAVVFAAADRTEVRTSLAGAPASAFSITAGEPASIVELRADHLQLESKRGGAVAISTSCPQTRLIRPIARGATSVFAVGLGPAPASADPLYGVETATNDAQRCPPATTSTISFRTPAGP